MVKKNQKAYGNLYIFFFFWQKKLHCALTVGYIDCRLSWFLCVVDSNGHAREIWLIWPFMELYICCASFLILLFVRLFRLRSGTSALQKYYMPESKLMFKLLDSTFTNCSIVKILKRCVRCFPICLWIMEHSWDLSNRFGSQSEQIYEIHQDINFWK